MSLLVILDQGLKAAIVRWLGPDTVEHRWELAGPYMAFQYVENRGAAFGMLEGRTTLLIVLAIAVTIGFVVVIWRDIARDRLLQLALALITAGAIGNLTDRIRLGYVIDFIAIGTWPKFNLADSCITAAVVLLAWTTFFSTPTSTSETRHLEHD